MKVLHISIIIAVIVTIASSIIGYYLFMPAWIYAEKTNVSSDLRIISLSDEDLKNTPTLEHVIRLSDASSSDGHMSPIQTSNSEGKKIASLIYANNNGYGAISYKNNTYSIYLSFTYGSPGFQ